MKDNRTDALQYGADGSFRWVYRLDPHKNHSMAYVMARPLLRVGISLFALLVLITLIRGRLSLVRLLILACMSAALMAVCFLFGLAGRYAEAGRGNGTLAFHYKMDRDVIRQMKGNEDQGDSILDKLEDFVLVIARPLVNLHRPSSPGVIRESFFMDVRKVYVCRRWNMIDIASGFARNAYYVKPDELDAVLNAIREEIPPQAKVMEKG